MATGRKRKHRERLSEKTRQGCDSLIKTTKGLEEMPKSFPATQVVIKVTALDTDTRFYVGDQTLWNDLYGNLPANHRRRVTFNHLLTTVNTISGHQRRNRKSTVVSGVSAFDDDTADQFTKVLMNINNQEGILETISDAFLGALVTGMNMLQIWVDYRNDPVNGNIKVDRLSYNDFLVDPYFRNKSLEDCNAILVRKWITKREAVSLFPDQQEEVLSVMGNEEGTAADMKFQFQPESYNYGIKILLRYDQFYYKDFRPQKLFIDTKTGETREWTFDNDEGLELFLKTYPELIVTETQVPTVNLAITLQNKVMYHGPNPNGTDSYPFVPVMAYYNPQCPYFPWRVQGVVRGARDSAYLYNRRKAIELDILESQINSGWIVKENALVNPKDGYLSGQGRMLFVKEEANMADVIKIESPAIPPTTIELSKILSEEQQRIMGVSEELMGFDNKDSLSGFHAALKMSASTTTLQILFDNLDFAQKLLGDIMIEIIQANYTPGKIKQILEDEEPTAFFYKKTFGKYNAVVEEGLNTHTQKQLNFAQLLDLQQAGLPIPADLLLEQSTIQNKSKLIKAVSQQQQQQAQMAQAQQEAQVAEAMARTQLAQARAQADIGLYNERTSRVEENRALAVQKLSEANKNDEQALLEKIKILKEIDDMDLGHIEKLLNMANMLKMAEQATVQEPKTAAAKPVTQATGA